MSKENSSKKEEEVDLAHLFQIIGNALKSLLNFIGGLLYNLYAFILICLIFLKKNAIILIATVVAVYAYNYYTEYNSEDLYEGNAIIQPNFQLEFELQSRVEEYNQLIKQQDTVKLSENLEIPLDKVGAIQSFEIEPIFSMNKLRFDYYKYIYEQQDTTLYKKFTFDMYVTDLRFEDYIDYIITTQATNKEVIGLIGDKIWDFTNSEHIIDRRKRELNIYESEKFIIDRTLKSIDSTRATQRQVMLKEAEKTASKATSTSIDVGTRQAYREDPQIYTYENELREAFVDANQNIQDRQNLVNVLKKFPKYGTAATTSDIRITAAIALGIVLILLLLFKLWKYLKTVETKGPVSFKKLG